MLMLPWAEMYIRHDFRMWFLGLIDNVLCAGLLANFFTLNEILNRRISADVGDIAFLKFVRQRLATLMLCLMVLVGSMWHLGTSLLTR
jgi:hypothetical protein